MHMDAAMMFFCKNKLDDDSNIILFVANGLFSWDDEGTLRVGSPSEWPKWFINAGDYPLTRWDDPPSTRTQTLARDFHDYRWVYAFEIFSSLVKNDEIRKDQCVFFWCCGVQFWWSMVSVRELNEINKLEINWHKLMKHDMYDTLSFELSCGFVCKWTNQVGFPTDVYWQAKISMLIWQMYLFMAGRSSHITSRRCRPWVLLDWCASLIALIGGWRPFTGWWQLKYFWNFHPDPLGKWNPILTGIFFKGVETTN